MGDMQPASVDTKRGSPRKSKKAAIKSKKYCVPGIDSFTCFRQCAFFLIFVKSFHFLLLPFHIKHLAILHMYVVGQIVTREGICSVVEGSKACKNIKFVNC
jgi:hypothetical protein